MEKTVSLLFHQIHVYGLQLPLHLPFLQVIFKNIRTHKKLTYCVHQLRNGRSYWLIRDQTAVPRNVSHLLYPFTRTLIYPGQILLWCQYINTIFLFYGNFLCSLFCWDSLKDPHDWHMWLNANLFETLLTHAYGQLVVNTSQIETTIFLFYFANKLVG